MLRAKEALSALPANAGDDFHYENSDEDLNEALEDSLGEEPAVSLPSWLSIQSANATVVSLELQRQASYPYFNLKLGALSLLHLFQLLLPVRLWTISDSISINLSTFRKK